MNSRACVFIDSRNPTSRNQVMNTISSIKPEFPPKIDLFELITKQAYADSSKNATGRSPNAFIIYRKAFVEAAQKDGYQLPMTIVSSMASQSWDSEPTFVKEEYKRLAKQANEIRNKIIPRSCRRKKREKWNIVSFPQPTPNPTPSSPSSSIKKPKKKKRFEKENEPLTLPIPIPSFDIPYDISSPIVDRFLDDNQHPDLPTINPAQQHQQRELNLDNCYSQSLEFCNQGSIIGEQIDNPNAYSFDAAFTDDTGYINDNSEFEYDSPGFLTFFDGWEILYPSLWDEP